MGHNYQYSIEFVIVSKDIIDRNENVQFIFSTVAILGIMNSMVQYLLPAVGDSSHQKILYYGTQSSFSISTKPYH
jgi:hypothetical protein